MRRGRPQSSSIETQIYLKEENLTENAIKEEFVALKSLSLDMFPKG